MADPDLVFEGLAQHSGYTALVNSDLVSRYPRRLDLG